MLDRLDGFDVSYLCGVDEAGRGPLAGDVYSAAVILDFNCPIKGLDDSKKISSKNRDLLYDEIVKKASNFSVGVASVSEIDDLNILQATILSMQRAVAGLSIDPELIIVDGNYNPKFSVHSKCIVKGDSKYSCIAAASIIAKVSRDRYMLDMDKKYPNYGFSKHKGYGTKLHYELITKNGVSDIHRKSFLKKFLNQEHSYNIGMQGELYAKNHLIDIGHKIIDTNFFCKHGEVDIISRNGDNIHFVEVKTRSKDYLVSPCESVGVSKKSKLIKSAIFYIQQNEIDLQPIFSVFEIVSLKKDCLKVSDFKFIENAFDLEGINI